MVYQITSLLKLLVLLYCISLLSGCSSGEKNRQLILDFNKFYNDNQWDEMQNIIAADFDITFQKDLVELKGIEQFKQNFDWGKIMKTKNEVKVIEVKHNKVITEETYHNDKIKLLNIPPVIMKATYSIKRNQIVNIDLDTLIGNSVHQEISRKKIKQFEDWNHHNDVNYSFEMTEKGAIILRKAILEYLENN